MNTETQSPLPPPAPPPKPCDITMLLSADLIALLRTAPTNATIRAHVLAKTLVPIPDALVDFDAIKDWLEANVKPPVPAPPVTQGAGFSITITCTDTEIGTARYRVRRAGSSEYALENNDLLAHVDNASDFEGFVEACRQQLIDLTNDSSPDMDWDGGADYDNHDSDDSENFDASLNQGLLEQRCAEWLALHRPALMEERDV